MQKGKLVVLGSINADHILNVAQFPRPGETILGQHYQVSFGGKGANQAVAAGRSGADTAFIACVGDDELGERIRQQLSQDNIDVQAIEAISGVNTGVALIFVSDEGENVIGIASGANACLTPDYLATYQSLIADADAVLMQLESPQETVHLAASVAKQHGTRVILNPAPANQLPDSLLAQIDIITPNETEAEILTGIAVQDQLAADRAARILHAKGIHTVIITLGSHGAWVSVEGNGQLMSGFKVKAVDTIAAGDTFNGALVTALLEGADIKSAVRFGHAAAAIAVTRRGAQPSVPWRQEIERFLHQQG